MTGAARASSPLTNISKMEQATPCDLRRTNIFLRLVLFFFTVIIVAAAVGLFFISFLKNAHDQTFGVVLIILAVLCYAAADSSVSAARLYRYGIEEALLLSSIAFLPIGIYLAAVPKDDSTRFILSVAAFVSLWIWYRFGLPYIFLIAMLLIAGLPAGWHLPPSSHRIIVAITYFAGIAAFVAVRPQFRATYLDGQYSIAEALLWFGLYLDLNLQLPIGDLIRFFRYVDHPFIEKAPLFYWTTWVLIWLIPAAAHLRGIRTKDHLVIAAGAVTALLTLVTNKPYLGWARHSWDPMLLGALLIGIALFIRRRLAQKPNGIRQGFTAQRLSGQDKSWMDIGVTAIGLASSTLPASQAPPSTQAPEPGFKRRRLRRSRRLFRLLVAASAGSRKLFQPAGIHVTVQRCVSPRSRFFSLPPTTSPPRRFVSRFPIPLARY